jgi:hypothetical protein
MRTLSTNCRLAVIKRIISQKQMLCSVIQFAQREKNATHYTCNKSEKFMKKFMVVCEITGTGNRRQKFKF